ncbi:MAG: PASTA domain-containing protein [Oscillospiraceae bacterium]|nr:PASTA domain-containing protein [Oscillospiraceae bacterium]
MANNRKNQSHVTNAMRKKTLIVVVLACLCFAAVAANMFRIQILNYEKYKTRATQIQLRETELSAKRGTIYDSNMKVLAQTATVWTIFVSPAESKEAQHQTIAQGLSRILEVDEQTILNKLQRTSSYYEIVKQKVDKPLADEVIRFCKENKLSGVNIVEDYKRYYPYGEFAATILGFCGSDNQGLAGLESYYDEELTGENGRVIAAKNGWGEDMGYGNEVISETRNGYSLVTTIDETVQHYLEKHLALNAEKHGALEGAAGIVMNVKTGAILAMANYPAYDPNEPYALVDEELYNSIMAITDDAERNQAMSRARQKQWRNKAVNDLYEPGSVFKVITASAAIDAGTETLYSTFNCTGAVQIENRIMKCSQTWGHGHETFSQALINSCNPAFIDIGTTMGKDTFFDYFYSFGMAEKTGIDLPGEQNSLHYTAETHTAVTLASSAFGQSNKVTPIQMITAIAAAVNGGNLVTPHLVSKMLDDDGNVVKDMTPEIRRQVISEETSKTIRNILKENVDTSAHRAYVAGYRVGGKSGTSQKLDTPQDDDYIASFVGVAPCDDPEIAVLILFDTPTGADGYYGGILAGPVVGALMGEILPYLGVEQVFSAEERKLVTVTTPSITGYHITDAAVKLQQSGLSIKTVGNGDTVISQYPAYGQKITTGSTIIAYTEQGEATMVTVPDLRDKSPQSVNSTLSAMGLNITEQGAYSGTNGVRVQSQSPNAGDKVPMGSTITITYYDPTYVE